MLSCSVVGLMDRDSGMDDLWLNSLLVDNWLDVLVN